MSKFNQKSYRNVGEVSSKYAYDRDGSKFEADVQKHIQEFNDDCKAIKDFAKERGILPDRLKAVFRAIVLPDYEREQERLKNTITEDCKTLEKVLNDNAMFESYVYLNECRDSKESGLYQLIYNGYVLLYGTLAEINATVKSLIKLKTEPENYLP